MGETLQATDTPLINPLGRMTGLVLVFMVVTTGLFWETAWSMVSIWNRSDTYAHGYLILPISMWLVWTKRAQLSAMEMKPVLWVQLLLVPGGLVWLLSYLTDVLVIQQLTLVGILIVGIWSLLGHSVARVVMFPLGFLFLGVPMGEDLVPPMMEFTATSTVWLIELTGIPVYREGLYFTLPSGKWSVVEACSGVRYLIASVTLGLLYAHLTYRSLGKQLLFVLMSILVPVLANSGRAYLIVMIGHLSGMTLAVGVDHLIYGWAFFGLVMAILFWLGSFWRDDESVASEAVDDRSGAVRPGYEAPSTKWAPVLALCSAIAVAGFWPIFAQTVENAPSDQGDSLLLNTALNGGWQDTTDLEWAWRPRDRGARASVERYYQLGDETVALYVQRYVRERDGVELVSGKTNQFIDEKQAWRIAGHGKLTVELAGQPVEIRQVKLSDGLHELQLWYWYRIGSRYTSNAYWAKWYEAVEAITFGRRDSALIVLATENNLQTDASGTLSRFLQDSLEAIESSLNTAEGINE